METLGAGKPLLVIWYPRREEGILVESGTCGSLTLAEVRKIEVQGQPGYIVMRLHLQK
jgi:hypothetical protein